MDIGPNGYPVFSSQTDLIRGDYSKVNEAINKVPADLSLYTDETASALQTVINGIDYNLSMDEQESINAMAKTIEDVIAALEYKPADYTAVNEAIAMAETLNPNNYIDFSAVDAALNAVEEGKNITEQDAVNACTVHY